MPETQQLDSIDWDLLRTMLAILDHGSFTAAAAALGVGQATISRRIAALEEAIGIKVFERRSEGPALTPAAQIALPTIRRMEVAASELMAQLSSGVDGLRGDLSVAVCSTSPLTGVARSLGRFQREHPEVIVSCHALGQLDAPMFEVTTARPTRPTHLNRRLLKSRYVLCGARALAATITGETDLNELTWVDYHNSVTLGALARWRSVHAPRATVSMFSSSPRTLAELVKHCGAVALLPGWLVDADPELVELHALDHADTPAADVWLTAHRSLVSIPFVAAAYEHLEQDLSAVMGR